MTDPTAGDPFATPPAGRPAAPLTPPGYSAPAEPQAYPSPDGYYPYGYAPQRKPKTWLNVTSLCVVAGGFVIPLLANITGIVFGHLGRSASKRGEADYAGVGLAGLILNYIGAFLWILIIIAYLGLIAWAINDCANDPYCSGSTSYGN